MKNILSLFICLFAFSTLSAANYEQTLAIIKPDAVGDQKIGEIISRYERAKLDITGLKLVALSKKDAEAFYAVHRGRPFYDNLVRFMSSGPIVVIALEGDEAVARNRELIGSTNPADAATGTLRHDYGRVIENNAVHGSDSTENARKEIAFFFRPQELCQRR